MTGTEIGAIGFGLMVLWLDVKSGLKGGGEIVVSMFVVAIMATLGGVIGYTAGLF